MKGRFLFHGHLIEIFYFAGASTRNEILVYACISNTGRLLNDRLFNCDFHVKVGKIIWKPGASGYFFLLIEVDFHFKIWKSEVSSHFFFFFLLISRSRFSVKIFILKFESQRLVVSFSLHKN